MSAMGRLRPLRVESGHWRFYPNTMKFDVLASVAHNIADSVASGASRLFNFWDQHVFQDVRNDLHEMVEIDFIGGRVTGGRASNELNLVVSHAPEVLRGLCEKHSISPDDFRRLTACYTIADSEPQFAVTIEDQHGRSRTDTYRGSPGKRVSTAP